MKRSRFALAALALAGCARTSVSTAPAPSNDPPPIVREMRGLWYTTVGNTDWPSKNNLTQDEQRAELIDLLDRTVAAKFNTVVFHVRPAGDAVYASTLEPWA